MQAKSGISVLCEPRVKDIIPRVQEGNNDKQVNSGRFAAKHRPKYANSVAVRQFVPVTLIFLNSWFLALGSWFSTLNSCRSTLTSWFSSLTSCRSTLTCLLILCSFHTANAQPPKKVILLGFYAGYFYNGTGFDTTHTGNAPCPLDQYCYPKTATWFYDYLAKNANDFAKSGFTAIWLPPMAKGSLGFKGPIKKPAFLFGGIYDTGYGVFDHYDLGDKLQQGNYQTRYGSRMQLTRCIAMMRANGLDVYNDFVTNQVGIHATVAHPAPPSYLWFQYKNAFGADSGGRFPKYTKDFHNPPAGMPGSPGGTQDPDVPATTFPDGSSTGHREGFFGPDFAHVTGQQDVNGIPGVYNANQLYLWGDWLIRATGIQGYRLDDVGGISWDFLKKFVNYGAMKGKFTFAELAGSDYGCAQLKAWLQSSMGQTGSDFTMIDQTLQPELQVACKTDKFNMGQFQTKYLAWGATNEMNPAAGAVKPGPYDTYHSLLVTDTAQVVTAINEVDSESLLTSALPKQCLLGYAYIMTIGFGTPCVALRDWNTDASAYGSTIIDAHSLHYHINKLIWCHNFIISGGLTNEYVSPNGHVYAFQKTGGRQAFVFLNSDQTNPNLVTVPTTIPNGTTLTDYTDHNVTATVTNGMLSVTVPANMNGRGYLVMAPPGITGSFETHTRPVTQEWDGAEDLSIPPAGNYKQEVCRIWVDNKQTITSTMLYYNITNWIKSTNLALEIDRSSLDNKTNTAVASRKYNSDQQSQSLTYTTPATGGPGYYSFWIKGNNLPATASAGYERFNLQTTYTASQTAPANFDDTIVHLTSFTKPTPVTTTKPK